MEKGEKKVLIVSLLVVVPLAFSLSYFCLQAPRKPLETRIIVTCNPTEAYLNESRTLNGTLEYHGRDWIPLPEKEVNIYYVSDESEEWTFIANVTTDSEGIFEYRWNRDLPIGEYRIKASFQGDQSYELCQAIIPPPPGNLLEVAFLSHMGYLDSFGYYHVVGEVQNVGDKPVTLVKVEVTFYDYEGTVIDSRFDLAMLDILLIGRKSPFEIVLLDATQSARVDHYSLSVTFSITNPIPTSLEILSHRSYVDEFGSMHIVGEIKNIATMKAQNVKVIATYYNRAGDVVAAVSTDLDPIQSDIDPYQTVSFEILLSDERTPYVDVYELTAESTQYAIERAGDT